VNGFVCLHERNSEFEKENQRERERGRKRKRGRRVCKKEREIQLIDILLGDFDLF